MNKPSFALASLVAIALAGCANKQNSTADLMRQHAAQDSSRAAMQKDLAKQWDRGNELIISGTKQLEVAEKREKQAEKQLRQAQKNLKQAKRDIAKGERLKQRAEKRFAEEFPQSRL